MLNGLTDEEFEIYLWKIKQKNEIRKNKMQRMNEQLLLGINNYFANSNHLEQKQVKILENSIYQLFSNAGIDKDKILGAFSAISHTDAAKGGSSVAAGQQLQTKMAETRSKANIKFRKRSQKENHFNPAKEATAASYSHRPPMHPPIVLRRRNAGGSAGAEGRHHNTSQKHKSPNPEILKKTP